MQVSRCDDRLFVVSLIRQFYRVDLNRGGVVSASFSVKHLNAMVNLRDRPALFLLQHPLNSMKNLNSKDVPPL